MKRWISGALALIIAFLCAQGGLALDAQEAETAPVDALIQQEPAAEPDGTADGSEAAQAEDEAGIVIANVDAEVGLAAEEYFIGDDAAASMLPAEDGALQVDDGPAEEAGDGQPDADAPVYAKIVDSRVEVCAAPSGAAVATLGAESVVLALGECAPDWTEIAFNARDAIETGCVPAQSLEALDEAALAAYMDGLAAAGVVALYNDDINLPLARSAGVPEETTPDDAQDAGEPEPAEGAPTEDPEGEEDGQDAENVPESGDGQDAENVPENGDGQDAGEGVPESGDAEGADDAGAEDAGKAGEEDAAATDGDTAETPADALSAEAGEGADGQAGETGSGEPTTGTPDDTQGDATAADAEAPTDVQAESSGLQLNASSLEMGLGEKFRGLTATGGSGKITWSSSNKKVVKVNAKTGVIKGVRKGSATVTATAADGSKASVTVTVRKAPKKIKFSPKKVSMGAGGMAMPLTLKMTKGAASAVITYKSSNTNVATVDANGVVTARSAGTAVITARTYNKKKAKCKISVYAEPSRVEMPAKFFVALGEKSKLGVQAYSANGAKTEAGLTYHISPNSPDPGCLSIDGMTGSVVGASKGTAIVTVVTHNGLSCGPCEVRVTSSAMAIRLPAKVTLGAKETRAQLPLELVSPAGESECAATVTWSSSNKKVVSVDPVTGELKALKKGAATIVARTETGLKAKCKVKVKKAPKKVKIKPASGSVAVGGTVKFSVALPKGAAGGYSFSSSNPNVAAIDQSGLATALAAGQTTITVTTYNGKKSSATLTVTGGSGDDIVVPEIMKKLGIASYQNKYSSDMSNAQKLEYVIYNAQNQLDKPYVYGKGYKTANPTGFDCSGFVFWCFYKIDIELEQSAYKQGYDKKYTRIDGIENLKRGDMVCFNTSNDSDLSDHTGIYLGNGYFIHASSGSSKRKVIVQRLYDDSISNDYYKRNFSWGRRILN